jgi:glycine/D-amino acid oxidase-like deaminating enzyme
MKKVDYIVVGCGLAGIAFCEQLRAANRSFMVFDNASQQASKVAAGLYNPVTLKRFTKVWNAKSQLDLAIPKYKALEQLLQQKLNHELPVRRKFASVEEQNAWYVASDQPVLSDFMLPKILKNANTDLIAAHGFGEVLHSGRIDTSQLVPSYQNYLEECNQLERVGFEHAAVGFESGHIQYKDFESKYIVFAEGFGLAKNPFFSELPLRGLKGEMLTIKASNLQMDFILKSSIFLVPLGDDLFWVGATYEHHDNTHTVSEEGKERLLSKLKSVITCEFEIVDQVAGIRPTTKDRRPMVGRHDTHEQMFVLNGLGTRGVMISPYAAKQLFEHIELGMALDPEIDIKRFN